MSRHSRWYGWHRKQPWQVSGEGRHRSDPDRPAGDFAQPGGPAQAVQIVQEYLESGPPLDGGLGPAPDGRAAAPDGRPAAPGAGLLRQKVLQALGTAALFASLGGWFGTQAWRSAGGDARIALAVVWAVALASAVWFGLRQRRAILADPWRYLIRNLRRTGMRRGGALSHLPIGQAGMEGASAYLALTRQRAGGVARRPRRFVPTHHGQGVGPTVPAYLFGTVIIVGLCTPAFLDPSVSATSLGWSTVGAFFVPVSLLGALAFHQCRTRDAQPATGPAAHQALGGVTGAGSAAGPDSPVSLSTPESPGPPAAAGSPPEAAGTTAAQ